MIIIKSEQYLSELGKGENNQDNGGWDAGNSYVVCDGDGKALGEVASEIVAQTFLNELHSNPAQDISSIVSRSENRITKFVEENPEGSGISSTLALLQFAGNRARIAWVGNSRVYHIRDGKVLFRTKDHSWVNDAVSAGIITKEEAVNHPKSKVITRAIQGAHKRTTAEEVICKDVRENDYFLLCSMEYKKLGRMHPWPPYSPIPQAQKRHCKLCTKNVTWNPKITTRQSLCR